MILIDTNVLIALTDEADGLHETARADARRLQPPFFLITPVIAEAAFALRAAYERSRLAEIIRGLKMRPYVADDEYEHWQQVFEWLAKYADHEPDWVDASLAVICGRERRFKLWTYDEEFSTIWRRPDGSAIPLAAP